MSAAMSASTPVAELMMAPARRPRLVRRWELGQLAVRLVSLSLEIISLAEFTFMSLAYQDDHPTNPIANAGLVVALMADTAEFYTLATLNRPWPQARLGLVVCADVVSFVVLYFSWIWTIFRGMFWDCILESNGNSPVPLFANCNSQDIFPSEDMQRLTWLLPFSMAGMHLIAVVVYCAAIERRLS